MGYFDFLDQDVQEAPSIAPETQKKKPTQMLMGDESFAKMPKSASGVDLLALPAKKTQSTGPLTTDQLMKELNTTSSLSMWASKVPDKNSPEEILRQHGVPHNDFHKATLDIAGQLGLDPDEHINLGLGLDRVLKLPGMEDVRQEWTDEAQRLSTGFQVPQGVGGAPSPAGQAPAPSIEDVERQNLNLDLKALANEEPLNNVGSVIAMVLLSMVIGPHLAMLFFRRSAKGNELAQQVADRREKLKEYKDTRLREEERKRQDESFMRHLAAESSVHEKEKRREEDVSLRHQIMLKELGSFIHATEVAKKSGSDEQQAMVKGLKNQWSSYTAQGNSYLRQVKDIQDEMYYNQGALNPEKKMKMLADEEQYRKLATIEFEKAGKIHQEAEKMFLKYGLTAGSEESAQDAEK